MKYVIGFLRFWYDFVIGDCWQIAAGVALVLGGGIWLAYSRVLRAGLDPPAVGFGIVLVAVVSLLTTARSGQK